MGEYVKPSLIVEDIQSVGPNVKVTFAYMGKYRFSIYKADKKLVSGDPFEISTGRALQFNAMPNAKDTYARAFKLAAVKLKDLRLKAQGQQELAL